MYSKNEDNVKNEELIFIQFVLSDAARELMDSITLNKTEMYLAKISPFYSSLLRVLYSSVPLENRTSLVLWYFQGV